MNEERNTILIIDDESMNILMLGKILKDYEVMSAKTGLEGFEIARSRHPDLILLDVVLPDINGFDLIGKLKDDVETKKIPVIFITAKASMNDEEFGLSLGARDYIAKPFSNIIVRARIRTQMEIITAMKVIERLSYFDPLTDLPNRRNFDERFNLEWRRAVREKQPISLIYIDLDKFKVYNDTFGHPQGDELLKAAANVFKRGSKRSTDLPARLGGEEFGILLPNTSIEAAVIIADNIRSEIEKMEVLRLDNGAVTKTTASLGVTSVIPSPDDRPQDFIHSADKMLYSAKESGRNRVVW